MIRILTPTGICIIKLWMEKWHINLFNFLFDRILIGFIRILFMKSSLTFIIILFNLILLLNLIWEMIFNILNGRVYLILLILIISFILLFKWIFYIGIIVLIIYIMKRNFRDLIIKTLIFILVNFLISISFLVKKTRFSFCILII